MCQCVRDAVDISRPPPPPRARVSRCVQSRRGFSQKRAAVGDRILSFPRARRRSFMAIGNFFPENPIAVATDQTALPQQGEGEEESLCIGDKFFFSPRQTDASSCSLFFCETTLRYRRSDACNCDVFRSCTRGDPSDIDMLCIPNVFYLFFFLFFCFDELYLSDHSV